MNLNDVSGHELFNLLLWCLADLLAIIPFFVSKTKMKSLAEKKKPKKYILLSFVFEFLDRKLNFNISSHFIEAEKVLDTKFI